MQHASHAAAHVAKTSRISPSSSSSLSYSAASRGGARGLEKREAFGLVEKTRIVGDSAVDLPARDRTGFFCCEKKKKE